MLPSLKIGRLFGIPVYLHSTLLLLPALAFFNTAGQGWPAMLFMLAVLVTLFTCVLLHEFGHALMARWFGIITRDVTLYPIGGIARLERMSERPIEEILIALAGPAVNVLIAALLTPFILVLAAAGAGVGADPLTITFADPPAAWLAKFCFAVWGANIFLVIFNLIPAFPMDGGRVFRAILAHFFGLLRATEIAVPIGIAIVFLFAIGMIGLNLFESVSTTGQLGMPNPMPLLIAAFIALVGPMELRALRHRERQKLDAQQRELYGPPTEAQPYQPLPYPDDDDYSSPAAPPAVAAAAPAGFSGYTWDGEFGVWVKWQNGRRVEAYWNGSE